VNRFLGQVEDFEQAVFEQRPVDSSHYDQEYFASDWRQEDNRYDLETRRRIEARNPALIKEVFEPERVLDVGCGTGQSTREAAQVAGSVLGVDVSPPALDHARRLSAGLAVVDHLEADAQTHPFPAGRFDVCISRFGVMFFADPVAAFTNIGRALRPGGRLVLLVWQPAERNEWSTAIQGALAPDRPLPLAAQGAFSLGDPAVAEDILTEAGFAEVAFTEVDEPVYYGPDTATACDFILGLRMATDVLADLDATATEQALQRLRTLVADHQTDRGVHFGSRAWIITARRRSV
jgi:SAM-dependent methyltransferase